MNHRPTESADRREEVPPLNIQKPEFKEKIAEIDERLGLAPEDIEQVRLESELGMQVTDQLGDGERDGADEMKDVRNALSAAIALDKRVPDFTSLMISRERDRSASDPETVTDDIARHVRQKRIRTATGTTRATAQPFRDQLAA